MNQAYILGGLRSFIGVRNGAYRHVPAELLGAAVLRELIQRYELKDIDMIIGGNSVGGGGNITRLMALEAGISPSIPALTLDLQCASSLEAIITAAARIRSGLAQAVIAGGFESSSTQPLRSYHPNHPGYTGPGTYSTARFIPGPHEEDAMLRGAENTISHYHISKEEMDGWVLQSHRRACEARDSQVLKDITAPVYGLDHDEGIRPGISRRLLDRLPCVVGDGRYLNAANACAMNDGAAFLVLCSEQYLRDHKLTCGFRLRDACTAGSDPVMSPASVLPAIKGLLRRSGLSMDEAGAIECNEAFAAIDVLFERAYPGKTAQYNRFGGALAYGHPYGASGAIITLHLLKSMEISHSGFGIGCAAAAGGIGCALLIERA